METFLVKWSLDKSKRVEWRSRNTPEDLGLSKQAVQAHIRQAIALSLHGSFYSYIPGLGPYCGSARYWRLAYRKGGVMKALCSWSCVTFMALRASSVTHSIWRACWSKFRLISANNLFSSLTEDREHVKPLFLPLIRHKALHFTW